MDIQERVQAFSSKNNLSSSIQILTLDLHAEMGEFTSEIVKAAEYKNQAINKNERIVEEMGDVIFSLCRVANYFDLDLEELLDSTIEKYASRIQRKTNLGST